MICTASSDGFGFHSYADRGTRLHYVIDERIIAEVFQNRKVFVFSPNCSRADLLERYLKARDDIRAYLRAHPYVRHTEEELAAKAA